VTARLAVLSIEKSTFLPSISLTLNHDNEAANFETSEGIKKF
jgi:hypothetical protein